MKWIGRFSRLDWGFLCAFALPFAVYVRTLAPTIYNLDSAELTTAAATLGLTRATGYPLYLLIGHLWSLLPVGDVGYRLNLFSAFCGALTITLLYLLLRRWRIHPWGIFFGLGLLACAPFFWAQSLIAEVYTLHTALMAGSLLLAQLVLESPRPARLFGLALCLGLSLGNHMTSLLLLPGLAWLLLSQEPRKVLRPSNLLLALGGGVLGLLVYLYIPIRFLASPPFNYAGWYEADGLFHPIHLATWQGLFDLVSGNSFRSLMFHFEGSTFWPNLTQMAVSLSRAFLGIGIGPGVLGIVVIWRKQHPWAVASLLIFAANVLFFASYRVIDQETMYLPLYTIWAVWAALGCHQLLAWARSAFSTAGSRRASLISASVRWVLAGTVIFALLGNWSFIDRSADWSARRAGESILAQLKPDAIYVGWWDTAPVMQYLQLVEGYRPDVLIINRFLISATELEGLIDSQSTSRPIYLSDAMPDLPIATFRKIEGVISFVE